MVHITAVIHHLFVNKEKFVEARINVLSFIFYPTVLQVNPPTLISLFNIFTAGKGLERKKYKNSPVKS